MSSGNYSCIGREIVVSLRIDDMDRGDQVRLMADLMRATGISDALFGPATGDRGRLNIKAYQKVADAYLAKERA